MSTLSQFGIAKRLYLVSLLLIAALGGVAITAWVKLSNINDIARQANDMRSPQLQRIGDIELGITRSSLQVRHAMLVKTPADLAATLADIGAKKKQIDQTFADFEKGIFTPAGREFFSKLTPLAAAFWEVAGANIKLIEGGKKDEAFAQLVEKTIQRPAAKMQVHQPKM